MASRMIHVVFIAPFFIIAMLLPIFSSANNILIGSLAPPFKITSGEKEVLTLDGIKGKVAVIFYEAKSAIEQNRKLKTALNMFYTKQSNQIKEDIIRIGVINCKGVFFSGAWEEGLRDNSKKEGIKIYGDWDGKMLTDYRMKEEESNVIIIDKKGIIRYYTSGKVGDKDIGMIEELLDRLVREN